MCIIAITLQNVKTDCVFSDMKGYIYLMTIAVLFLLLQCSMWTCPVRVMNRTARGRSVAVPWSLFPREPTAGHVLSLSLIGAYNLCAIPSPIFLCVLVLSAYCFLLVVYGVIPTNHWFFLNDRWQSEVVRVSNQWISKRIFEFFSERSNNILPSYDHMTLFISIVVNTSEI